MKQHIQYIAKGLTMLPQKQHNYIPASSDEAIRKVVSITEAFRHFPQQDVITHNLIHGGMYARTIRLDPDVLCCGTLIKVPTIIIIEGNVLVYTDNDCVELKGYNIFAASKHRKQAVFTKSSVNWTMIFRTDAKTIAEAEEEFTDEVDQLISRKKGSDNINIITGE
jgi:hypothetical protein